MKYIGSINRQIAESFKFYDIVIVQVQGVVVLCLYFYLESSSLLSLLCEASAVMFWQKMDW